MKIEEVIAKLRKNNTKYYRAVNHRIDEKLTMYNNTLVWTNKNLHELQLHMHVIYSTAKIEELLFLDFEEVEQEVPWQEALKAWAEEGKTIKCVHGDSKEVTIYYWHQNFLRDGDGTSLYKDEIRNGKWYIEY